MKYSFYILLVAVGTFAFTQSAYANPDDRLQANYLMTQPATITNNWGEITQKNNNFQQVSGSLSGLPSQLCQKNNPLDFVKNPTAFLKECQGQKNNQSSQYTEPIEYLKFPRLNSGIKVQVTKF